jgi:hypothetical protein
VNFSLVVLVVVCGLRAHPHHSGAWGSVVVTDELGRFVVMHGVAYACRVCLDCCVSLAGSGSAVCGF